MGLCFSRGKMPPHTAVQYGAARPPTAADDVSASGETQQSGEFHKSFDSRLWLFTRSWQPRETGIWATLMIVHGTVDHSGVYAELGKYLASQGIAVFASDMRGWGRSDGEALYVDSIDSFMGDIIADYDRIHSAEPYKHVKARYLLGKSIGGLFAAWTVAEHSSKWTGLIGLSGAFQIDPSVKPSPAALMFVQALAACAPKFPFKQPFDPKLIVSDEEALEEWRQDPLVSRGKLTPGYILEMIHLQDALREKLHDLALPVLMLWGTGDHVVTEAGHSLVLESSKSSASQFFRYPNGFHNLLAEPKLKDSVTRDICEWMRKLSGNSA